MNPSELSVGERASRILYLNKTCFNGLYRVNSKGQFNVSFGYYEKPLIVDEENLRKAATAFQCAELFTGDFELVLENVHPGDAAAFRFKHHYFPPLEKAAGGWRLMGLRELQLVLKYTPESLRYMDIVD